MIQAGRNPTSKNGEERQCPRAKAPVVLMHDVVEPLLSCRITQNLEAERSSILPKAFSPPRRLCRNMMLCPSCKSSRYRDSRWMSRQEKLYHPTDSPYRCLDCSHRFFAKKNSVFRTSGIRRKAAILVLVLFFFTGLGLAFFFLPTRSENQSGSVSSQHQRQSMAAPRRRPAMQMRSSNSADRSWWTLTAVRDIRGKIFAFQDRTPEVNNGAARAVQLTSF